MAARARHPYTPHQTLDVNDEESEVLNLSELNTDTREVPPATAPSVPPPQSASPSNATPPTTTAILPGELQPQPIPIASDGPMNGWTQQIEIYVSSISIKCKEYRNIHEGSTIYYDKRNSYFTIFLIFVSFVVTAISLIPFFTGEAFKYVIALLSLFTTTLTTVNKFLKYQESSTKHRLASQRFLELHRNITEQFLLPFSDRINGKQYISQVGRSFDQIIKTTPYPPEVVKTRKKLSSTPDSDIQLSSRFASDARVIAVPNPSPSVIPGTEAEGTIAPQGTLQVPQTGPIQSVNPDAPSVDQAAPAGGYNISAMARYQLQRARGDMDMYSGDYD